MRHAAYVFDAYGTLFDVHSAVRHHADAVGPAGALLSELWRTKQLEYSWVRTLMDAYVDFWQLTEQALDYALARLGIVDPAIRQKLLDAYRRLECFPEVPLVLRSLKASGAKLAILSNGSPEMLSAAVKAAHLEDVLDHVFSVDGVRRFKTDPSTYEMVTKQWRLEPAQISFQSSNRWDVAGAAKFGFRPVWINRNNLPDEYLDLPPSLILPSLEGLLEA
jgi:2-haloacid dehalogenase